MYWGMKMMHNIKTLLDLKDRENAKFWISHAIVLIGTVIAVYLAASAGLKSAVQFELIKSDRDSYYMRSALLDELNDNLEKAQQWGEEYKGGNARKFIDKPKDFALDAYVWKTMQDSPATFEIPSEILTQIRRYYTDTEISLRKMTGKDPAAEQVTAMLEKTNTVRVKTIPLLEQNLQQLEDKLKRFGITP